MVGLIPEKTVEVWTACSLLAILGQGTWIWSRATGYDQDVELDEWADALSKWFVLELKAPQCGHGPVGQNVFHDCRDPHINIDLPQLAAYVAGVNGHPPAHPDVLYVLPDTPWCRITADGAVLPDSADPTNRLTPPVVVRHPGDTTSHIAEFYDGEEERNGAVSADQQPPRQSRIHGPSPLPLAPERQLPTGLPLRSAGMQ